MTVAPDRPVVTLRDADPVADAAAYAANHAPYVTDTTITFERLHAALGFEPIGVFRRVGGKLDQWCDVTWVQRALSWGPDRRQGHTKSAL